MTARGGSDRPRIGLDLLCLRGDRTGMAWVSWWQARWLPRLAPGWDFVFFLPPEADPPTTAANVRLVRVPFGRYRGARLVSEQWSLPRAATVARLDLLHTIAFGSPAAYGGRKLLTVHDLAFRLFPETVPWRYRAYWNWAYGPGSRGSDIVAVSEATRRDLVRLTDRAADSIAVVPNGVDPAFTPAAAGDDPRRSLAELGLPPQFLLSVGTLQPRKDPETLFATFAKISAARADLQLVICGARGWGDSDPEVLARRHGLAGKVRYLGYTPRRHLPDLYRAARLLLCTSRYEGFGLPILESMASGTPVVATDSSSIPEVAGEAALLAPVGDAGALARCALELLGDPARHARMSALGLARARLFTWQASATRMIEVYRGVLPEPLRSVATGGAALPLNDPGD